MVAQPPSGYSARVRLELVVGGEHIPLNQIGGGRLMFGREVVLPGTTGVVVMHLDERVRRWQVTWDESSEPRRTVMAEFREMAEGVGVTTATTS